MRTLSTQSAVLLLLLVGAWCAPAQARLSDLEAFTDSAKDLEDVLQNHELRRRYLEALERYAASIPKKQIDFQANLDRLRKMRSEISGLSSRLVPGRKPMAFQYSAPSKPTYRFERVNNPFNAIFLLGSYRENKADVCTERDTLLIDRWTPMLKDASLFTVEKNEKFTGTTLTLVPVKSVKALHLLVVPNDPDAQLPADLLSAFLRDYRKREPGSLPFALIAREPGKLGYQIFAVDAQGRRGEILGPVAGFRLNDPMARKIVASVPTNCVRRDTASLAPAPSSGISASPSAPTGGPVSGGGNVNISAQAMASVNATQAAPRASAGGNSPQLQQGQGPSVPRGGNIERSNTTTRVNNVTNNFVAPPTAVANSRSNSTGGSVVIPVTVATPSGGGPALDGPSSVPVASGGGASSSSRGAGGFSGGGPRSTGGGGGSGPTSGFGAIDRASLSPSDQRIYDAVERAQRNRQAGSDTDPRTFGEVARGALEDAKDPVLKREAEKAAAADYFDADPEKAYAKIRQLQKDNPNLDTYALAELLKDKVCDDCDDCAYCRGRNRRGIE